MPKLPSDRQRLGQTMGTALYAPDQAAFDAACDAMMVTRCALLRIVTVEWLQQRGWIPRRDKPTPQFANAASAICANSPQVNDSVRLC
jgi:hypothetical protein